MIICICMVPECFDVYSMVITIGIDSSANGQHVQDISALASDKLVCNAIDDLLCWFMRLDCRHMGQLIQLIGCLT